MIPFSNIWKKSFKDETRIFNVFALLLFVFLKFLNSSVFRNLVESGEIFRIVEKVKDFVKVLNKIQ